MVQQLDHNWCAYFDNVTSISYEISDLLCRAVTGDGFSKRELYSDDDDVIYSYKRCIGINGINNPATRPDLLDRSILFRLERIPKSQRKTEKQVWSNFQNIKPKLLGSIFSILSKAMQIKESIKLEDLPRMADFAEWGEAISQAMGYQPNSFIGAYHENIGIQNLEAIEGHVIGSIILELMRRQDLWEGTATDLFNRIKELADELRLDTKAGHFPKAPNSLRRKLNEIKSNLADENIFIDPSRKGKAGTKLIKIIKRVAQKPSEASVQSEKTDDAVDTDDNITTLNTSQEEAVVIEEDLKPKKEDLLIFIKEKGETGYDMNEFSERYGKNVLQALLNEELVYESSPGIIKLIITSN